MNASKQISQLVVCNQYIHDGMPEWKSAYLTIPVTASLNDFLIRHQSDCVSLYRSFKCPGNDCGQNIAKAEKQLPHFAGLISWN